MDIFPDDFTPERGPSPSKKGVSDKTSGAKKKYYHEKIAEPKDSQAIRLDFIDPVDETVGLVAKSQPSHTGKILSYITPDDQSLLVHISNKEGAGSVVIGDSIVLKEGIVQGIVTRANLLARYKGDSDRFSLYQRALQPIAANLDFVVIVASAKDPRFQPGFIDRYMLLTVSCQIPAIICISKSDLTEINDPILDWYQTYLNIPVVYTSSSSGQGLDTLRDLIRGKTVVFVGKSGVGKSSLTNAIVGSSTIKTSEVSQKGQEGRHTTTASEMYEWDATSYIIDTPGIRSLDFLEFSKEELSLYFSEFEGPAKLCKYRDCSHEHEGDCGVKDAVHTGTIPESRYHTYLRLLGDIS